MASLNKTGRSGRSKSASNVGADRAQDEFVDVSFDDVIVVDRSAEREPDRAGEPVRVCLLCGEEEPAADGACAHDEVAAFAEAPATVFEAAERVRRAMAELVKAQRALSAIARSAATSGEAVIDERPRESAGTGTSATVESAPCAVCAERAALEARDHERAKVKRKRALNGHGQAAFAFASEPSEAASEPARRGEFEASERAREAAGIESSALGEMASATEATALIESTASSKEASATEATALIESTALGEAASATEATALIESTGAHNEDGGKGRRRRKSAA